MTSKPILAEDAQPGYISTADLEQYYQHLAADFTRHSAQIALALKNSSRTSPGGKTHTLDDVRHAVMSGRAQLWCGPHSVLVTEISDYPQKRILHGFLAAGRPNELVAMFAKVVEWARLMGCQMTRVTGRPALARVLKSHGWAQTGVVIEREV